MNKFTVNFLHLLVLVLSIGSLESSHSGIGVEAAPVDVGSRRSSVSPPSEFLDARSRKARIGVKLGDQSSKATTSLENNVSRNFPTVQSHQQKRGQEEQGGSPLSVPLSKLPESSTSSLHPQMQLQHHMNLANAKLDRMRQRRDFTKDDQKAALLRRRDSLFTEEEQQLEARRIKSGKGRTGRPGGRQGVVMNTKTGFAGKPHPDKRNLIKENDQPHNLVPVQAGSSDTNSTSDEDNSQNTKSSKTHQQQAASTSSKSSGDTKCDKDSSSSTSTKAKSNKATKTSKQKNAAAASASGYDIASQGYPTAALTASDQDTLLNATTPDTVGSLALDIEANDVGYVAVFDIGTAGGFRLLVDSGSADTWVASTSCKGCSQQHKKLGKSTSSSFQSISPKKPFSITYGTGSVSGMLGNDTLKIGDYTVKSHTFGLATKESQDFSDDSVPFDGLMGLAQQSLSSSGTVTPIDGLYQQGAVPQPVMGYHLARAADGKNDGEVTFGGVNAEKYTGDLVEMPNVSEQGFWEATLESVSFDGKAIDLPSSSKSSNKRAANQRTAILDTGTTLIVAPQADADALHSAIPGSRSDGQGGYTIPCTTAKQVSFKFGGQDWKMDARDMVFLPVDENNLKGDCVSAISAGTVGQKGEWLVGAAFLKNVYFATNTKSNTLALGHLS
ncbi:unnamed protein product [Sympodiomycopsis kandeliae]